MDWVFHIVETGVIPGVPLQSFVPEVDASIGIDVPCFCYVLVNAAQVVLVDSGPDDAESAAAGLSIRGRPRAALLAALAHLGIARTDVAGIVHTHLHHDHMQNDTLFPGATVWVQRAEFEWAMSTESDEFYVRIAQFAEAMADRLVLLDGEVELMSGIVAVPSGGHTPGHQSVLVQSAGRILCVCGDVVSLEQNLKVVGSVCPNRDEAEAFLLRAREAQWEMIPSHEAALRRHPAYTALTRE